LHDFPLFREFAKLDAGITSLPDKKHHHSLSSRARTKGLDAQILATVNAKLIDDGLMLKTGTELDATLFAAPR
jgi:IS5 family transposase